MDASLKDFVLFKLEAALLDDCGVHHLRYVITHKGNTCLQAAQEHKVQRKRTQLEKCRYQTRCINEPVVKDLLQLATLKELFHYDEVRLLFVNEVVF